MKGRRIHIQTGAASSLESAFRKEFRQVVRDPSSILIAFVLPASCVSSLVTQCRLT